MKTKLSAASALFLAVCLPAVTAASLDDVFAKMNAAAPKFSSMMAGVQRVTYTKVLDEKATESGVIRIRRQGKEIQVLMEVSKPDPKWVSFRGKKAQMYLPRLKTLQEYDLGKHGSLIDQFLLIGFGTTGPELQANYNVKLAGEETVAGQKTWKLQLTPKDAALKEKLQSLILWIDDSGSYPVQQQFLEPSGDYYLFTYLDVKLNPGLTEQSLRLIVPPGTKRETVNK